jgi:hypothetical protein
MRRHHYRYGRDRYLTNPAVLAELRRLQRSTAASQAREIGLLDPHGPGSWTHPDPSRMIHADGKVIAPLFRSAEPRKVDTTTGEIRAVRHEADAAIHFEGDGEAAFGTKFVLVATRTDDAHGRIILDCAWVPRVGGEAQTAVGCFAELAPSHRAPRASSTTPRCAAPTTSGYCATSDLSL